MRVKRSWVHEVDGHHTPQHALTTGVCPSTLGIACVEAQGVYGDCAACKSIPSPSRDAKSRSCLFFLSLSRSLESQLRCLQVRSLSQSQAGLI